MSFNGAAIRRARVPIDDRCVAPNIRTDTSWSLCGGLLERARMLCPCHWPSWKKSTTSLWKNWISKVAQQNKVLRNPPSNFTADRDGVRRDPDFVK